jgi:hypothetical protein
MNGPTHPGRRRLASAGIASGVIMTLKSPSALGAAVCKSPSGALSGGLSSQQPAKALVCRGRTPAYWCSQNSPLPAARNVFGKVFTCNTRTAAYRNTPLFDIFKAQTYDRDKVGMYLMAAYFNAYTDRTSFLKIPAVISIWNEWQATGANAGGTYTPIAGGKKWDSRQLVAYLASTME